MFKIEIGFFLVLFTDVRLFGNDALFVLHFS